MLADEQGEAREGKTAGDVVVYIYLTEIEAGLQSLQRNVDLKDDGFAIGGGDFLGDYGPGLVDFCCALKKFNAGEDTDGIASGFCGLRGFCGFALTSG